MSNTPGLSAHRGWLFGPVFDSLFISNIFWPLLFFLQHDDGFEGRGAIQFWQVYFITIPHRWITIVLVLLDRQRFRQQSMTFVGLAIIVITLCAGIRIATGTLTCLLAVDYVWNAWHFAAQHHGIYRIYARMSPDNTASSWTLWTQKWMLRGFLLYVILRIAGSTFADTTIEYWTSIADWCILLIPACLLISEFCTPNNGSFGRRQYLISLIGLYLGLLWSVHTHRPALTLSLATASAWFHASEYLSVVGWQVQKRSAADGSDGTLLNWLAPRWIVAVLMFAVLLGSSSWMIEHRFLETWLLINIIVAFLHYSYDGLIWKSRRVANHTSQSAQRLST